MAQGWFDKFLNAEAALVRRVRVAISGEESAKEMDKAYEAYGTGDYGDGIQHSLNASGRADRHMVTTIASNVQHNVTHPGATLKRGLTGAGLAPALLVGGEEHHGPDGSAPGSTPAGNATQPKGKGK